MFGNAFGPTPFDLKFRLLGVDARVHPTFWLGGFLFTRGHVSFVFILAGIATLFVSILIHEMGHALTGKRYGDTTPAVTLHVMGGHYTPGRALRHGQFIWMIVWGPLADFILGALAILASIAVAAGLLPYSDLLVCVLWDLVWINIIWGVVNILPVFPLDGGQIFREVVRWKFPFRDDAFSYTVSLYTGATVAVLLLAAHLRYQIGLFPALLFGSLAYQNFVLRKHEILTGGMMREEEQAPRQPWEREADWWKSGGKDDPDWWKKG